MPLQIDDFTPDLIAQLYEQIRPMFLKEYGLSKRQEVDKMIGLDEFIGLLPMRKGKEWVKTYIFEGHPETRAFVYGLNAGRGHPIKINERKAIEWINANVDLIDWRAKL